MIIKQDSKKPIPYFRMENDTCNRNSTKRSFKLYNRIRQINPLCVTQKPKVLLRKNILTYMATQDSAPRRACAHNGYKRRPPEPSTSRIRSKGSDKFKKATKQNGRLIKGNLQKISQTSFKIPSKLRTNFRSEIDTSGIHKTSVNQYRQLVIKHWDIFSLDSYEPGHTPLKIKEIHQEHITSVHEQKKEKSSGENTFNSPMNICGPILKNTNISTYHGTLIPSKFDFKKIINRSSGTTYLKSNPLEKKAAFQNYEHRKNKNKQDDKDILHRLIKLNRSTYSYTMGKHITEEKTTQKIMQKLR